MPRREEQKILRTIMSLTRYDELSVALRYSLLNTLVETADEALAAAGCTSFLTNIHDHRYQRFFTIEDYSGPDEKSELNVRPVYQSAGSQFETLTESNLKNIHYLMNHILPSAVEKGNMRKLSIVEKNGCQFAIICNGEFHKQSIYYRLACTVLDHKIDDTYYIHKKDRKGVLFFVVEEKLEDDKWLLSNVTVSKSGDTEFQNLSNKPPQTVQLDSSNIPISLCKSANRLKNGRKVNSVDSIRLLSIFYRRCVVNGDVDKISQVAELTGQKDEFMQHIQTAQNFLTNCQVLNSFYESKKLHKNMTAEDVELQQTDSSKFHFAMTICSFENPVWLDEDVAADIEVTKDDLINDFDTLRAKYQENYPSDWEEKFQKLTNALSNILQLFLGFCGTNSDYASKMAQCAEDNYLGHSKSKTLETYRRRYTAFSLYKPEIKSTDIHSKLIPPCYLCQSHFYADCCLYSFKQSWCNYSQNLKIFTMYGGLHISAQW